MMKIVIRRECYPLNSKTIIMNTPRERGAIFESVPHNFHCWKESPRNVKYNWHQTNCMMIIIITVESWLYIAKTNAWMARIDGWGNEKLIAETETEPLRTFGVAIVNCLKRNYYWKMIIEKRSVFAMWKKACGFKWKWLESRTSSAQCPCGIVLFPFSCFTISFCVAVLFGKNVAADQGNQEMPARAVEKYSVSTNDELYYLISLNC